MRENPPPPPKPVVCSLTKKVPVSRPWVVSSSTSKRWPPNSPSISKRRSVPALETHALNVPLFLAGQVHLNGGGHQFLPVFSAKNAGGAQEDITPPYAHVLHHRDTGKTRPSVSGRFFCNHVPLTTRVNNQLAPTFKATVIVRRLSHGGQQRNYLRRFQFCN